MNGYHRGVRKPVKWFAVIMVILAMTYSVGFSPLNEWLKAVIAGCGIIGIGTIIFVVPTVRDLEPSEQPLEGC